MQDLTLVIPLKNEANSITTLVDSINEQIHQPDEIILVDGGSTDGTVQRLKQVVGNDARFKVIEAGPAMPGKGRNIGAAHAATSWIAFTDAGIKLDKQWLRNLVKKADENPAAAIVYGNYSPIINSFFDKCAAIAYVAPKIPGKIRGKFIASSLYKKEVWEKAGGFPDWRAAEDLIFMENTEKLGYHSVTAPDAMASWELRPTLLSTFKRFDLYSKHNVWAGRQAFWHYGVARQYTLMLLPLAAAIFHSWYWLLAIPMWFLARAAKRILMHRYEFGWQQLFNPAVIICVIAITVTIDMATFSGWVKALISDKK
jgi:glycosyltransferase involved in cell wall biosynthesis